MKTKHKCVCEDCDMVCWVWYEPDDTPEPQYCPFCAGTLENKPHGEEVEN